MKTYDYHHIVGFEESNLVGNVYYVNHIRWQGRCREMFLRDHAPEVLDELNRGLSLVTIRVSCEYFHELFPFDEVIIRMSAGPVTQSRVTMLYEYLRAGEDGEEVIARGEQQIGCMWKEEGRMVPAPVPKALREALARYLKP